MTRAGLICTDVAPRGGRGSGAGGGRAVAGGGRQKYSAAAQNDGADGSLPSCVAELSPADGDDAQEGGVGGGGLPCSHWGPTLTPLGSRSA